MCISNLTIHQKALLTHLGVLLCSCIPSVCNTLCKCELGDSAL